MYVPTVGNSKPASLRKFWMWALPAFKADKKTTRSTTVWHRHLEEYYRILCVGVPTGPSFAT